jgi:protocatechuate 3,4-dioxygenase beta subunit
MSAHRVLHRPHHDDDHEDYGGLHRDLGLTGRVLPRRELLRLALGAGALSLLGCSADGATGLDDDGDLSGGVNATCSKLPEETAGPYPGDGSNGPSVLNQVGVVRRDIRPSFAGLSGAAEGIALTVVLTVASSGSCTPLAGRAVYLWHCDREGRYSLYSSGVTNQNYLRGVQETDANGRVTFTSIFPGCYAGRWPHIHFDVYPSLAAATNVANKVSTSQLAFPKAACDAVYATAGYQQSVTNLSGVSLATDGIFRDGYETQLAAMTGSVSGGFTATLTVPI